MRKVRMVQWSRARGAWFVETPQGILIVRGWDEAMFLAQLLADPHEYIRAAQERAWEAGFDGGEKDAFSHQTFNEPCIPNPYREGTQS